MFKYDLDLSITHPEFDLIEVRNRDLQIITSCPWDALPNNSAISELFYIQFQH